MKQALMLIALTMVVAGKFSWASAETNQVMDRLLVLAGEWDMTVSFSSDKGKTWQKSPTTRVGISMAHKNKLLKEIPIEVNAKGFNMETYLTWDQYRKVFRKAAIDDVWGVMDIYEGNIQGKYLIMDNLKAGTSFPVAEDTWRHFRLKVELATPQREMIIEASDDHGATWFPAFKVNYQLIQA